MGDPRMTEHLGGPESPDKLRERQERYKRLGGGARMFKIVDPASGAGVGSVGFWTKEWRDEPATTGAWTSATSRTTSLNRDRTLAPRELRDFLGGHQTGIPRVHGCPLRSRLPALGSASCTWSGWRATRSDHRTTTSFSFS